MTPVYLTIDVDWVPDFMIAALADCLVRRGMKATWFVTHDSPAVRDVLAESLFEVGIHPNIAPNSTQGEDEPEIFGSLLELVPGAVSVRTHGNVQSTNLTIRMAEKYGLALDASYFLPRVPGLRAHPVRWNDTELLRVPYCWEDAYEASQADSIWTLDHELFRAPGLQVLNFHPVHWFLNTVDYRTYHRAKRRGLVHTWTPSSVEDLIAPGYGPGPFLRDLATECSGRGRHLRELLAHPADATHASP